MKVSKKMSFLFVIIYPSIFSQLLVVPVGGANSLKSALEVLLCIPFNNPLVNDTQWKNH